MSKSKSASNFEFDFEIEIEGLMYHVVNPQEEIDLNFIELIL